MNSPTKIGTVALVVRYDGNTPILLDCISDDLEIATLDQALNVGQVDPLEPIYDQRKRQAHEDDEFGNYVEELICQPFVRKEILEHGVQWLHSKIRIEEFQRREREATGVIAQYAFRMFQQSPWRKDFILCGPTAKVRIRIISLEHSNTNKSRVA